MKLIDLNIGECGTITEVGGCGALRQHFLDMGMIPGTVVCVVKYAPMGDPIELLVHDYKLTLRISDAAHISVDPADKPLCQESVSAHKKPLRKSAPHPGLGEYGKSHAKSDDDISLRDVDTLRFALIGNQNCGKTTLFNQLTGSNQHVGNFPGVTVDRKDGPIKGHPNTVVTDLPGIYSMSPYSSEEIVSRDFLLLDKPDGIINIVDATNIERNLYLTMQLLELGVPMVVALNMMDELTNNGGTVDINRMEALLGVPVIPISAAKNQGVGELVDHAIHVALHKETPLKQDFCDDSDNGGAVHRCIHAISHLIEDHTLTSSLPLRFASTKVIESDRLIMDKLQLDRGEKDMIESIILQMEKERRLDRSAAIADMRYTYIKKVCAETVKKPRESKERIRSEKIDKVLTGKLTAIPAFILIMGLVFYLSFDLIGSFIQGLLENGITALSELISRALISANVNQTVRSLVTDGIFAGVGSVLSFLPVIITLFFFLSILEDSGYIARVAFVMDKLLRKIGLSGRSIVPMLIGFGCTVPAVMATRTLPSERDRKMTLLLTPFMSCSAKLPIYAFLVAAFFPKHRAIVMILLYVVGILMAILTALLFRCTLFKSEPAPFVMELPNYRLPGIKNVLQLLWEKAKDFLSKAFTVILIATIVVWLLQSFDFRFDIVSDSKDSMLASIAGLLVPIMRPIGLGDWRICTSLISGFMAKESVVSTMEILYSEDISAVMTRLNATALLVFSLLYTPCVAAIASIRRELGRRWAYGVVIFQCALAWVAALVARAAAYLIGL